MKKIKRVNTLILLIFISISVNSQNFNGKWMGSINNGTMEFPLVFNIESNNEGFNGTMDSPSENIEGIPLSKIKVKNDSIKIEILKINISYEGRLLNTGSIEGYFIQNGYKHPLNLSQNNELKKSPKRYQEPVKPYSYYMEDVTFYNDIDGVQLSGTLSLPNKTGTFPAVVLLTGSGPQNRDQEVFGHKPFLVLSDYLVKHGIAVLRYDDRGVGQSKGSFADVNSLNFAQDAIAAINFLENRNETNKEEIGLIGHSEGGLIAPLVANISKNIDFFVLMATPGVSGDTVLLEQVKAQGILKNIDEEILQEEISSSKKVFEIIKNAKDEGKIKAKLRKFLTESFKHQNSQLPDGMILEDYINFQVQQLTTPWMQYFLQHDPKEELKLIKIPVLAINGDKDVQVIPENLARIENTLKSNGNQKVNTVLFSNLNHFFQTCITGDISEYSQIEETIHPEVLSTISNWIIKTTNNE